VAPRGLMRDRSALADSPAVLAPRGASPNSLRSLRSLRSDTGDEPDHEARWRAPPLATALLGDPEIAPTGPRLPR